MRYKTYDINIRIIIPDITKVRLKTCVPYIIKYPIPALLTKNSPIITPINVSDILQDI